MKATVTMQEFINEFNSIKKLPLFEIQVLNKETKDIDYIIFDISIRDGQLIAMHESLTKLEQESSKVATKSIDIDIDFSMDENLGELYDMCINAICNSDFFKLSDY